MKTIRLTVIALLAAALAEVAMGPVPAGAGAPPSSTCALSGSPNGCLVGSFTFRLAPAKSFAASLASDGDPADVEPPDTPIQNQNLVRSGTFTANGYGGVLGHSQTTVTDQYGTTTLLVDYHWSGSYTLNGDLTGTLNTFPALSSEKCTNETSGTVVPCGGNAVGPETYAISLSFFYDLLNMVETDNNAPNPTTPSGAGGGKIFMTGQALKQ